MSHTLTNTFKTAPAPVLRRENTLRIASPVRLSFMQRLGRQIVGCHPDMSEQSKSEAYQFGAWLAIGWVAMLVGLVMWGVCKWRMGA